MYRDPHEALRARVDVLQAALSDTGRRLEDSERSRRATEAKLERLAEGVATDVDEALLARLRRVRVAMLVLGLVGATLATSVALIVLVRYFETPRFDLQGLRNAWVHVRDHEGLVGLGWVALFFAVGSPALVLPWLAARDVVAMKRQAWMQALLASALWAFTPLLPLALYALGHVVAEPVRRAFFAAARGPSVEATPGG
ncbi:MAG: hypothetical protein H6721_01915 [Sandaracinus sp.]|nr:hypothetical protein [Sandaracinus sp.]